VLLAGAALVLAIDALWRLLHPEPLTDLASGLWVAFAGLMSAALVVVLQSFVVQRTGSTAITADRAHYLADVAQNAAVLAALALTGLTGEDRIDPVFALVIALYMIFSAKQIAASAWRQLLDHGLPFEQRQRIEAALRACRGVRGLRDLRTRDAGEHVFVEFTIEIDEATPISEAQATLAAAEQAVLALPPIDADVFGRCVPADADPCSRRPPSAEE
jgi:ferrous-iron efflux pump FieF